MERIESDAEAHRRDDLNQFGQLRTDIAELGTKLADRIDKMGENLQGQITDLTLDKERAVGRAEGVASVAAAAAVPKWWASWLQRAVFALCAGVVGLLCWMGSTIWAQNQALQQARITAMQERPSATVTVSPAVAPPAAPAAASLPPGAAVQVPPSSDDPP